MAVFRAAKRFGRCEVDTPAERCKRAFLVKSSVKILRIRLGEARKREFAHNNLRSGSTSTKCTAAHGAPFQRPVHGADTGELIFTICFGLTLF